MKYAILQRLINTSFSSIDILVCVLRAIHLKRLFVLCSSLCAMLLTAPRLAAQSSAGEQAGIESNTIVDMPTAGVLARGKFSVAGYMFGSSGAMAEFNASPLTNLQLGLSFGGTGFLGNSGIGLQALPGFHIRFRALDETLTIPALVVGVQTQGRGVFTYGQNAIFGGGRFETHSPGLFVAASKNFSFLGSLALHGGICFSLEQQAPTRLPNAYIGIEKTIGSIVSLTVEYNPAIDDAQILARGGLLNAGVRMNTGRGFTVEVQVRDILRNLPNAALPYRLIRIEFVGAF